jgi:hypothetical protein
MHIEFSNECNSWSHNKAVPVAMLVLCGDVGSNLTALQDCSPSLHEIYLIWQYIVYE